MNTEKVIELFKKGVRGKSSSNVVSEGDVLYSYGKHFPLAVDRNGWFLLNGDKYSVTTSGHQGTTQNVLGVQPNVSFSAIRRAGIDYLTCELIDFRPDSSGSWYRGYDDVADDSGKGISLDDFIKKIPLGAEIHKKMSKDTGEVEYIRYHRIGTVILRQDKKYWLCSMDEGSYFVSLLPRKVKTVAEGFEALQPRQVKGKKFKRQGEWFFVDTGKTKIKELTSFGVKPSKVILPNTDSRAADHVCTKGIQRGKKILVTGTVRHRPKENWRNPDHKMLKLGKTYHYAYRNTALENYSSDGSVD